jgi:ribosomal protein S18 acetylase RimI-like enzyme
MEIRPGSLADLNACLQLDSTFETEHVWQMEVRSGSGDMAIGLHLARLPRPMKVTGVISADAVTQNVSNGGTLFVGDDRGRILGYVDVTVSEWNQAVRINNIAVAPAQRRHGLGSSLLWTALEYAQKKRLRVALLDTSTKAYPAICFYQKHGFAFCGFSDQLYPNRDIAMFFAKSLR